MNVGEPSVDAVFAESQPFVVDSQQMEDGGVDVVDLGRMASVERFVAPFVALSVGHASLDAAASEPVGEDVGIVIATGASLGAGHAAELCRPENERVL